MSITRRNAEQLLIENPEFGEGFWRGFERLSKIDKYGLAEFLVNELRCIGDEIRTPGRVEKIFALVQSIYPFDDSNIQALRGSLLNSFNWLVDQSAWTSESTRDYLLWLLTDILYHSPKIIEDASVLEQEYFTKATIKMAQLAYKIDASTSESYLKNHNVILGYLTYFSDSSLKNQIIQVYKNHFDSRLKEDLE